MNKCIKFKEGDETMSGMAMMGLNEATAKMQALYGENKKITDGNYDRTLAVKCINGTFVGKKTENIIAYKGIPFVGKQPVGEYRWKAPVDVTPDDGVYEAYYFGKVPCQVGSPGQMGGLYPQGEDCLHLNIWKTDDKGTQKKPVMVWIHGGAYELGGTPEPREEGTSFVQENPDIILVSIEYRLNALGFLRLSHLPDGADYPDSQNLGLMDQLAALKWIHENIEGFGGDSGRVTIFGQSAGGGSVSLLPLVKGSHKYFQRVIAQSGSPAFCRSTEQSVWCTNTLIEELGCKTVAELMKLDVQDIVNAASKVLAMPITTPERDGKFLPLEGFDAYERRTNAVISWPGFPWRLSCLGRRNARPRSSHSAPRRKKRWLRASVRIIRVRIMTNSATLWISTGLTRRSSGWRRTRSRAAERPTFTTSG